MTKTIGMFGAIALLLASVPTFAATVITPFTGGPFSVDTLGTIPATKLVKGNTYDFTFTMAKPLTMAVTSIQTIAQRNTVAQLIQFQVYSGNPGSGNFLGQSVQDYSPTLAFNTTHGNYYIEVTSKEISKSGEVAGGTLVSNSVPEPASWALMLLGVGGVGFAIRRKASLATA